MQNSLSKEERIRRSSAASKRIKDRSASVRKQWETIKSNPILKEAKYKKLQKQAVDFWSHVSDEEKNRIISTWLKNKSRSKVCDEMKSEMEKRQIFGFLSEQPFHGYFPDEINHELKIIVEMYGDLYHCNPKKYKDGSQYIKAINRTVGQL